MSGGGHGHDDDGLEEEHEEHVNHEAWVIPYADMLTLLMALFLMLFAIGQTDLAKFRELAAGAASALGGGGGSSKVFDGGPAILEGAGAGAGVPREQLAEQALRREEAAAKQAAAVARTLSQVEDELRTAVAPEVRESVVIRREPRGVVLSIVADAVLFTPGGAALQPAGHDVLRQVAASIRGLPNSIVVEGHTDDVPISTSQFRSNWELSTARATEVLRVLVDDLGVPAGRVAAAGYGEQRPVASNATAEGRSRNRRVELAILAQPTAQNEAPATPPSAEPAAEPAGH